MHELHACHVLNCAFVAAELQPVGFVDSGKPGRSHKQADHNNIIEPLCSIRYVICNGMQNDYPMQTPSPGAFVTPSPSGYSHVAPPALPYRAPAPARGAVASHGATPSTHPGPSPSQTGAGSSQRWKFMDDNGKLRKVSGRLFSEPSASLR